MKLTNKIMIRNNFMLDRYIQSFATSKKKAGDERPPAFADGKGLTDGNDLEELELAALNGPDEGQVLLGVAVLIKGDSAGHALYAHAGQRVADGDGVIRTGFLMASSAVSMRHNQAPKRRGDIRLSVSVR